MLVRRRWTAELEEEGGALWPAAGIGISSSSWGSRVSPLRARPPRQMAGPGMGPRGRSGAGEMLVISYTVRPLRTALQVQHGPGARGGTGEKLVQFGDPKGPLRTAWEAQCWTPCSEAELSEMLALVRCLLW